MPHSPEQLVIEGREIGRGHPTYIIAEISANHLGSLERCLEIVDVVARAGADAVKIQTYRPDTLTIESAEPPFRLSDESLWAGRTLFDLYREGAMPWEWYPLLRARGAEVGVSVFSTPFDPSAVDYLDQFEPPAYKIASFELVDLPLIAHTASKGRPIIMSTGMATESEIEDALSTAIVSGARGVALLHCRSSYPAKVEEMDLVTIPDMESRFSVPVGLSDHTMGSTSAVVGVALGAKLIEKHVTLSRSDPGPDSSFSLEPQEFADLVERVRQAETSLGHAHYGPTPSERSSVRFRRSLFVVEEMAAGETFTEKNVRSIRPADGLSPKFLDKVLGARASRFITKGTPLSWNLVTTSIAQNRGRQADGSLGSDSTSRISEK